MAISANTVWEVRATASADTNGGGFVAGASGTDFSLQDSPNSAGSNISTTNAVANGTTTITSSTASFTSAIVGNIVYFQGGTGSITAQWRQVTAFTNSTTITIDTLIASSTGMTMNIGGALVSPGVAVAQAVASNTVWIKSATYTISSATAGASNGVLSTAVAVLVEGYGAARGDLGTAPVLNVSGITAAVIVTGASGANCIFANLGVVSNTSLSGITGFRVGSGGGYKLSASNCTANGFKNQANTPTFVLCTATGCTTAEAFVNSNCFYCEAYANTFTAFTFASSTKGYHCIAYGNSGGSTDGFSLATNTAVFNCVAFNNGRHGFTVSAAAAIVNSVSTGNAGFGFTATSAGCLTLNCAGYSNTSGNFATSNNVSLSIGSISLTGDPFQASGSGNFALNNTAGAGALLRAAGIAGVSGDGNTLNYQDIGVAQHADPANPFCLLGTLNISPQ